MLTQNHSITGLLQRPPIYLLIELHPQFIPIQFTYTFVDGRPAEDIRPTSGESCPGGELWPL